MKYNVFITVWSRLLKTVSNMSFLVHFKWPPVCVSHPNLALRQADLDSSKRNVSARGMSTHAAVVLLKERKGSVKNR